jgi:hypothetical protein
MDKNLTALLLTEGGPILRWRTALDLVPNDNRIDRALFYSDVMKCPEVSRWLQLLGSGPIHHSQDSSAENVLAKLVEYGLRAGDHEIDERILPYTAIGEGEPYHDDALILAPFLVRMGYADEPSVANWLSHRIDLLNENASRSDYDLYMDETERKHLPSSQHDLHGKPKLFYKSRFNHHWSVLGLPTCYDLYALAYLNNPNPLTRQKIESIIAYMLNPAFQETQGGYVWNPLLHRSYAAGRVFLACLPTEMEPEKLVLFLEIMAHFERGRASAWFRRGMAHLDSYRTELGTYLFPSRYLSEKSGYYLYAGMHMGLGEMPRDKHGLELESTFHMLQLKKLVDNQD